MNQQSNLIPTSEPTKGSCNTEAAKLPTSSGSSEWRLSRKQMALVEWVVATEHYIDDWVFTCSHVIPQSYFLTRVDGD